MYNKGAQITIYILFGLIILISLSAVLIISQSADKGNDEAIKASESPLANLPVKSYLSDCLDGLSRRAIGHVSYRGGYYIVPPPNLLFEHDAAPFYYYADNTLIPKKKDIEEELAYYINAHEHECRMPENYEVVETGNNVSVALENNSVYIYKRYKAKGAEAEYEIDVSSVKETAFTTFVEAATEIVGRYNQSYNICLSCLRRTAEKHNLTIDYDYISNRTILFSLNKNTTHAGMLSYNFLVEAPPSGYQDEINIDEIPDMEAVIGYEFYYNVLSNKKNVSFSDNTDLFDIDKHSGEIRFYPKEGDIGRHYIRITASDDEGEPAIEYFTLDILHVAQGDFEIISEDLFVVYAGEKFNYDINVSGKGEYFFSDDSELFNISAGSGVIEFVPGEDDRGDYEVNITVVDNNGSYRTKKIRIGIL